MNSNESARLLFQVGAAVYVVLGGAHLLVISVDMVRPRFLTPRHDEVRQAMRDTGLALTDRMSMWRAWLGFNASHGLGVLFFGLVLFLIAAQDFDLVLTLRFLMPLAVSISVALTLLSIRFWFYAPTIGCAIATACFAVSFALI